jgi:hypothetical protein
MTLNLTDRERQALQRGEAVRLTAPGLGDVIVQQAEAFEDALAQARDKAALAQSARKAAERWAQENQFDRRSG